MKVLIGEDKKTWHRLLEIILSLRGIDVVHAYTPKEVINEAVSEKPDVAVVDYTLSGGTSYEVIKELTDLGVPVIAVGYEAEGFNPSKARELGAFKVLAKPFTAKELLDAIKELKGVEKPQPVEPTLILHETPTEVQSLEPEEVEVVEVGGFEESPIEVVEVSKPEEVAVPQVEQVEGPKGEFLQEAVKRTSEEVKGKLEAGKVELPPEKVEEIVKEVAWEVIPEIAEKVIREEIERLIRSRLA